MTDLGLENTVEDADSTVLSDSVEAVGQATEKYETALESLMTQASGGTVDLSTVAKQTAEVQVTQAISEMVSGVAKSAADQVKGTAKKI